MVAVVPDGIAPVERLEVDAWSGRWNHDALDLVRAERTVNML